MFKKAKKNRWGTVFLLLSVGGWLFVRFQPWLTLDQLVLFSSLNWQNLLLAFFEASLVGSLADWFAVSALFRRPLGLPLPHTNIIAQRKNTIAEAVPEFLLSFVTIEKIRAQLSQLDLASKLISAINNTAFRSLTNGLLNQMLQAFCLFLESAQGKKQLDAFLGMLQRKVATPETFAGILHHTSSTGLDQKLFPLAAEFLHKELNRNRVMVVEQLTALIKKHAGWQRLFVGKDTSEKLLHGLLEELQECATHSTHWLREFFHSGLQSYSNELLYDNLKRQEWRSTIEALFSHENIREKTQKAFHRFLARLITQDELRALADSVLNQLAAHLSQDPLLRSKMNQAGVDFLTMIVQEAQVLKWLTKYLSHLLQTTPSEDFSRKVEGAVWNDLQYIRVNGAVVGGLAGILLAVLSSLLTLITGP